MLGGQLGGLINARLELCAQSAPTGHVIAQHQQQPEVQGWAHPAMTAIIALKTHACQPQSHSSTVKELANASRTTPMTLISPHPQVLYILLIK